MNYALAAAAIRADYRAGKLSRAEFQAAINRVNIYYATQPKKCDAVLDKRNKAA